MSTIVLDATTKKIKAKLAASGTAVMFLGVYADTSSTSAHVPGTTDNASNGTSYVDVFPAPASSTYRQCKELYCYNGDSVAHTITLAFDNNGTVRVIAVITLQAGESKDLLAIAAATGAQLGVANTWDALQTFSGGILGVMFGLRNKIINGDLNIWDYGTTFTDLKGGNFGPNQFRFVNTSAGKLDVSQSADVPTGVQSGAVSSYSLKILAQTADATVAAADVAAFEARLEGNTLRDMCMGSLAVLNSISFWVKSSKAGVYYISLRNSAQNRNYLAPYTVAQANTWEKKTVTFASDTSGTWLVDTGIGLRVTFTLMGGTDVQGTASTWQAGAYYCAADQANFLDTTNATFYIAQLQMEVSPVATPFEQRPLALEKTLCARYLGVIECGVADIPVAVSQCYSTTAALSHSSLLVAPRIPFTGITLSNVTDFYLRDATATRLQCSGLTYYAGSNKDVMFSVAVASGLVAGNASLLMSRVSSAKILLTGAEL
jgi:hypothetical protein